MPLPEAWDTRLSIERLPIRSRKGNQKTAEPLQKREKVEDPVLAEHTAVEFTITRAQRYTKKTPGEKKEQQNVGRDVFPSIAQEHYKDSGMPACSKVPLGRDTDVEIPTDSYFYFGINVHLDGAGCNVGFEW